MTSRPTAGWAALSLAAALLVLVAVASFGYGVAELLAIRASRPVVGGGAAILLLGYAVFVLAVARGVFRGRRWSRAPALATSLIQLFVAWSFRGGGTWWFGLLLGVVSATVVVCVLLPSSTAIFVPEAAGEQDRADG